VSHDGTETEVPLGVVLPGDRLRVRPGERVPVDGVVTGATAASTSRCSPRAHAGKEVAGERVVGGTLNTTGALMMRAEKVGADTLLAHIVGLVSEAQRTRAPIQRVADAVAGYFVRRWSARQRSPSGSGPGGGQSPGWRMLW